jgi:arginine decarboxylase
MDQAETPLADAAEAFLADARITPFTTPGHKRAPHLADDFLRQDLPLSSGADDLHARGGYLAAAEGLGAGLWRADLCRFCLNGSTQGNQALALAAAKPGQRAIVSRNLHKSVFAGLVLAGLEPVWIRPEIDRRTGLAHGIRTEALAAALAVAADAQAVVLVEPSFVGVVSDVAGLARVSHEAGIPLIVDQAWGAHFGFHPGLPPHSLALGADAMVVSAHKTLTSFTQGAYLFAQGARLDLARVSEAFDLLHTTSPSAAILASLDRARHLMATRGEELLGRTLELAAGFRERMAGVEGLTVVDSEDPTKLVLALAATGADGLEVEDDLLSEGIRLELANRDTLIPLLTIADTRETVERLAGALLRALERRRGTPREPGGASVVWSIEPEVGMSPREAFFAPRETVPADRAVGRLAAETVAPYPPGIPALAPGEVVTALLVDALRDAAAAGTRLAYCSDPSLGVLQVVSK